MTSQEYVEGKPVQTIDANGLRLSLSSYEVPKAFVAEVAVVNDAGRAYNVLPDRIRLIVTQPKEKQLQPKDPAKIIASIRCQARWQSAFDEMGAAMQQQQATTRSTTQGGVQVVDNRGGSAQGTFGASTTTTTTVPDWETRRAAATAW